jgi:hypothetical protein
VTDIVRRRLAETSGDALCDACLAFASGTSLGEMRALTRALAAEDPDIRRGAVCASCGRTVASILLQPPLRKCALCSHPLAEDEVGVAVETDVFHDRCLRRLVSDETVRMSRTLDERSRKLIEQSRRRMREGRAWPDIDSTSA